MFSKAVYASLFVCTLVLQGHAHAIVVPALGVKGTAARSDVQKPSTAKPCGSIPVSDLDTSTAAPADAQGNVDLTVTNFNAGADGSRQVTAQVSADGTGKTFAAATVATNGDAAPTDVGSQPLVVQLPAGTKCTGGTSGNLCLMSFKTSAGFGNCVAVSQGAAATGAAANGTAAAGAANAAAAAAPPAAASSVTASSVAASSAASSVASAAASSTAAAGKKGKGKGAKGAKGAKGKAGKGKAAKAAKPAGARAVRAVLASGEDVLVKRSGVLSWIWQ